MNTSVFTECLPFGILLRETTPLGISLCETLPAGIILRITPMREILLRKTPRKLGKFLLAFVVIAFIHRYTDSSPCNFHLVSLTDIQNYTA